MFSPSMVLEVFVTLMPLMMIYMTMPSLVLGAYGSILPRATYQNLQARNLSTFLNSIPTQCQVQCDIVQGAAHSCEFLACVCTREHALDLQDCVNCVVALTPYADGIVEQYQAILDEWQNSYCGDFSSPPLHVILPGQASFSDTQPTPSSTSGSASSSAPASSAASSTSPSSKTTPQVPSSAERVHRRHRDTILYHSLTLGFIISFISMVL